MSFGSLIKKINFSIKSLDRKPYFKPTIYNFVFYLALRMNFDKKQ